MYTVIFIPVWKIEYLIIILVNACRNFLNVALKVIVLKFRQHFK